jgi:ribosome production factor 2
MHFASELFDTHPRFIQLKSLLLDFFNGEAIDAICLAGIEHVISITLSPTPPSLTTATLIDDSSDDTSLPTAHIRTYTINLLASGNRIPRVELTPMGPSLDLTLRRHQPADPEMWKQATKKPKMKKQDIEKGLGTKRKNIEVDEMGDVRGRVHLGRQELGKLQVRKMKGLKEDGGRAPKRRKEVEESEMEEDE